MNHFCASRGGLHGLRLLRFSVVLLALALLSAPARSGDAAPVEARDALGRQVCVRDVPQRIVTIFSSNTEIVAALGLAERIVGIDAYTHYPDEIKNKAAVGGRLGFSLERIVDLRPDLVIMTPARQATNQLLGPLESLGIPALVLVAGSVEDIMDNIIQVARLAGVPQSGEALVDRMRQRLQRIARKPDDYRRPRVVMITGRVGNGLLLVARAQASRTTGYTADAVVKAGGVLALDEKPQLRPIINQVSPEALLAADPDMLLYTLPEKDMDDLAKLPGWSQMKAVRRRNVHAVSGAQLLIPGPRIVDGIEQMATLFSQWNAGQ
jgi:iron complex transport system substrate-binding protein